ncbi:hypothetical protein SAMN05421796_101774 [Chryseobacterium piscicola]|uniref:Uncharacterized protein n=1 Tax=Chryseobacterium piscicola TaxID=551459 RepID=A0A1N7KRR5_9FLAO|nr:hypothetical protein [Chryseobacterium piscicola]PQA94976.1 hypothetical protein B0A70_06555 [Chryseobacterium piscicola]SIS64245.1 hypothetical protein SAMN05421796_101774 [Chryseobacterium piscicola]
MKKSLQKFEVKKLNLKYLELVKGGKLADGSNCGTAETNTSGADQDADGPGGSSDADNGGVLQQG